MRSDIVAVILNWNCAPDTIRCLRAVAAGTARPDVIVVDNGSVDDSVAQLERLDDDFGLVKLDRNLGYAGGMNAGIAEASTRGASRVWLLNADAVPRPGALQALLETGDRYAVAASRQVTSAGPGTTGTEPYVVAAMLHKGKPRPFRCAGCTERAHDVDVVTGAALLIGLPWIERVGTLDERFFHYKEEYDLVRRIAEAGGRVGLVCASEVWHQRGASLHHASPRAQYYFHRNEILYVRKHYARPMRRLLVEEPIHYRRLATSMLAVAVGGRERRGRALAVLAGYWDGVRDVHGPTERF
jgi:GT2 family glycosyltransferase